MSLSIPLRLGLPALSLLIAMAGAKSDEQPDASRESPLVSRASYPASCADGQCSLPALVIWYHRGDNADRDRAALLQAFRGRCRVIWRDVASPEIAVAAKSAGITGVPTVELLGRQHWRFPGYQSPDNLRQRIESATADPETTPALPAIPRQQAPDPPVTSTELDALRTRLKSLEQRQDDLHQQWELAIEDWSGASASWQQSLDARTIEIEQLQRSLHAQDERIDELSGSRAAGSEQGAQTREHRAGSGEQEESRLSASGSPLSERMPGGEENKELSDTAPPAASHPHHWWGFSLLQLAVVGGIAAATGGTGVLAWWAGTSIKRRVALMLANLVARRLGRGRPEVRSADDHFPRLHQPDRHPVPLQPAKPGEYQRTETGYIRSRDGGEVVDRFEQLATPPIED